MSDVFAELKTTPYWWEAAPRINEIPADLPEDADVLIIGAGFSGINAARVLARASFFGTRLGYKMLGQEEKGTTAFDDLPFESRPLYTGTPSCPRSFVGTASSISWVFEDGGDSEYCTSEEQGDTHDQNNTQSDSDCLCWHRLAVRHQHGSGGR